MNNDEYETYFIILGVVGDGCAVSDRHSLASYAQYSVQAFFAGQNNHCVILIGIGRAHV